MTKPTKWEYCSLRIHPPPNSVNLEVFTLAEGAKTVVYGDGEPPESVIAGLGLEGWEMIDVHLFDKGPDYVTEIYYFKRPIGEQVQA